MIYAEMGGRCGNQMFLYAFARKLETIYGDGMCFNFFHVYEHAKEDSTWKDDLKLFNVKEYQIESLKEPLIYKYGNFIQKIVYILYQMICRLPYRSRPQLYKRQEFLQPFINRFGIYNMIHGYSEIRNTKFSNQFVCGTYEDDRFFNDIREMLLEEFSVLGEIPVENRQLFNIISGEESVCVSFRRGDFINAGNKSLRDICTEDYYSEAIAQMKRLVPNAKFVFFSDDIEWVKEHCDYDIEAYYESGNDSVEEKMRLMSGCKHFIMSNSTFCWWAQYLSTNNNKIVVSPDHWFNMPGYKHQLIGKDWILIKC